MAGKLTRFAWIQVRMVSVLAGLGLLLSAVLWKGHKLQYEQQEQHLSRAEKQFGADLRLRARRGSIVDRNGVELAASADLPTVYADPKYIATLHEKDQWLKKRGVTAEQVFALNMEALREAMGEAFDEADVRERFQWRTDKGELFSFVVLARRLSPDVARRLEALKNRPGVEGRALRGLGTMPESRRFYPQFHRAGQLLGFVGRVDSETDKEERGREGLELAYEDELAGESYKVEGFTDIRGRRITMDAPELEHLEGNDLVLTIDERIQYIAETELAQALRRHGAESGSVVVSDPRTGDILAMASLPVFNPNRIGDTEAEARKNRAVLDVFEPGSTFKCFTLAAALDAGVVQYEDAIDTEYGAYRLDRFTIHDTKPARSLRVWEVLKYSSNIGALKIGRRLGKPKYHQYLHAFGFGERPQIPLASEYGRLPAVKRWNEIEMSTATYGYGVNVTNLQLNMALGVIANGGTLYKPRLVREIRSPGGELVRSFAPEPLRRVISERASRLTARAMTTVVEEGGTGTAAATAHYKVAGKTGTARGVVEHKYQGKDGKQRSVWRYSDRHWRASFVGFAPAEDPALVITVVINVEGDRQSNALGGGRVAAPVFSRIAQQALPLMGVFPRGDGFKIPKEAQVSATPEVRRAETSSGAPEIIHHPPSYQNGVKAPAGPLEAQAEGLEPMPSYVGLSLRRALALSRERGHEVRVEGSGQVQSQSPGPGTFVKPGTPVLLRAMKP